MAGQRRVTRRALGFGGSPTPARPLFVLVLGVLSCLLFSVVGALLSPERALALPLAPVSSGAAGTAGATRTKNDELPAPAGWPLGPSPPVLRTFDPPDQRYGAGHRGVDVGGRVGQEVLSAAAGRVRFAGRVAGVGVVVVDHGATRTTYQPVAPLVAVGDRVELGQTIGRLQAGHCPREEPGEACLHWGLLRGETYLDPLLLIPSDDPQSSGHYRLVAAGEIAAVRERRQAAFTATNGAGAMTGIAGLLAPLGAPGRHGFAHPVPGGITSPFGRRFHPILHVWKLHDGTDFGAACGTPIRAPFAGRVVQRYANAGYGNRLMLDHGVVDGHRVITGYNHAIGYVVGVGARVQRGQLLGYVGETGYATGCHLHLMVWVDGQLIDPMTWF